MKHSFRILYGLFLLLHLTSQAQESFFFRQINTNNGLSNNKVNCILQDTRGFMWIGTDDGLNRYDGFNCTVFRSKAGTPGTIGGNMITGLQEDEKGVLWIATADGGLSRYDYKAPPEQQFLNYRHNERDSNSIPTNSISCLACQQPGYIWLGTGGRGVARFDVRTGQCKRLSVKKTTTILALQAINDTLLWAGSQGGGVLHINLKTAEGRIDAEYTNPYKKLPHVVVASLFKDALNRVWLGSWDKQIYRYDARQQRVVVAQPGGRPLLNNDDAYCFAGDDAGRMWIGSKQSGLYVYDEVSGSSHQFINNPAQEGTLSGNMVYCLYKDRNGNMWCGTNKGLSLYRPPLQQFGQTFLPSAVAQPVNRIYDFYQDANGRLLAGTSEGLFVKNGATGQWAHPSLRYDNENLQATFFYQHAGQFYIGTDYTLFRVNTFNWQCSPLPDAAQDVVMKRIIESRVVSMAADTLNGHPVLWTVPYGHFMAYYDFAEQRWVSRLDSTAKLIEKLNLKDNLIRKILVTPDGARWIATAKAGLGRMGRNENQFRYYSNSANSEAGLAALHVYDLLYAGKDSLWVSTYGGGLYLLNTITLKFKHIGASPNLCEGLMADAQGRIWFIANTRLWRYVPAADNLVSWPVPDLEKSGGIGGRLFKDGSNNLYAMGNNYLVQFDPAKVSKEYHPPAVYITDVLVNEVSHPDYLFRSSNRFRFTENTISFRFAAPQYADDEPLKYEYRLNGRRGTVIANNTVSFPDLPPASYQFDITAISPNGQTSTASFRFRIVPPFYRRLWFYGLCAVLVSGAIYAFYRYRINELVKRQTIRNKIARDLHDNIGSTLGSISVYGKVGAIHNERGNSKELDEILARISAASSEMIDEMNDIVWAINPGNDSMEKLTDRMHTFAAPLLKANDIDFNLQSSADVQKLQLDMEKRKNLYLIFKECLHNAIKYAGCKNIRCHLWLKQGQLHLEFSDDGKGFDLAAASTTAKLGGAGLPGLQQRAKEMNGTVSITSAPGKGTKVLLKCSI